jgi:hypothetical protein
VEQREENTMPKTNLATLTVEENTAWIFYFTSALEMHYGPLRADNYAWRHICKDFPRLASFHGCKP